MKLVLINVLCNFIFLMIDSTKCKGFTLALFFFFRFKTCCFQWCTHQVILDFFGRVILFSGCRSPQMTCDFEGLLFPMGHVHLNDVLPTRWPPHRSHARMRTPKCKPGSCPCSALLFCSESSGSSGVADFLNIWETSVFLKI